MEVLVKLFNRHLLETKHKAHVAFTKMAPTFEVVTRD